ncbi:MAG: helix-turn-helix transcriptional regulator [Oscillospiraceae bacterium]|nr:helix-turn-helix transcriptional regulator [Oscillospiraceae bacterium]
MEHSEIILRISKERGITPYRLSKETGISQSLFNSWKRKPTSNIYSSNLVLIADYLGCSVDYLLGRTEDPELHQRDASPDNRAYPQE